MFRRENKNQAVDAIGRKLVENDLLSQEYLGASGIRAIHESDERVPGAPLDPARVLIDHVEEHTVGAAREEGFWCAMTLYPTTKCTPARAADIIEMYGDDRIMVNSAGDWGPSNPLAVPDFIQEMRRRGIISPPRVLPRRPGGSIQAMRYEFADVVLDPDHQAVRRLDEGGVAVAGDVLVVVPGGVVGADARVVLAEQREVGLGTADVGRQDVTC